MSQSNLIDQLFINPMLQMSQSYLIDQLFINPMLQMSQSNLTDQLKLSNLTARLDGLEKRQEEVNKAKFFFY